MEYYQTVSSGYSVGLRNLNLPIGSGDFNLDAGTTLTVRLYYRSVEDGTYGNIKAPSTGIR